MGRAKVANVETLELVEALKKDRPNTGIFLDFDGTLAPVVVDPGAATPLPGASEVLEELARTYARVAIISGRRAEQLHMKLGARGIRYVGLYGAEEMVGGKLRQPEEAIQWRENSELLAERAADLIVREDLVGCEVEPKGLAVSIHYRKAKTAAPPQALLRWADEEARALGFHFGIGRLVLELRPTGVSKAAAFERSVAEIGLKNAFMAGDDSADMEAMAAAGEIVPGLLLRVGIRSAEEPEDLMESTDVQVESCEELLALLRELM
jgi:trehalose 6-phosphate phosphatase